MSVNLMMDDRQARRVNEAARKFADALVGAFETVSDRTVSAQALSAELTQDFFDAVIDNLRAQGKSNLEVTQELIGQQQRQREAVQMLTQESVNAHMEFLDSMFIYHRQSIQAAERSTSEG